MVFGIDATETLRWFHPAFERADSNPASIPIEGAYEHRLLSDVVEHDLPIGKLVIFAVFSQQPLHVADFESAAARGERVESRFDPEMSVQSIEVLVRE